MKIKRKEKSDVKINTTSLPDIIFMLLFFFMVTTVMQNKTIQELQLPSTYGISPQSESSKNDFKISIGAVDNTEFIKVNSLQQPIESYKKVIQQEIKRYKEGGQHIQKVILYIDGSIQMSTVNKVKSELQKQEIYKVNYIHDYKVI